VATKARRHELTLDDLRTRDEQIRQELAELESDPAGWIARRKAALALEQAEILSDYIRLVRRHEEQNP
jgi:hypothetical protein